MDKARIIVDKLWYLVRGGFVKGDKEASHSYLPLMDFWESIPHSPLIFTKQNVSDSKKFYSKFVVGGDQVWNPIISKYNSFYFLDAIDNDISKYSFAPSFGISILSYNYKNKLSRLLNRFRYVGCRDVSHCEELRQLIDREVVNTVDPVLLLSEEYWHDFSSGLTDLPQKYLLCYELGNFKTLHKYAEREATERNLNLVCMSSSFGIDLSKISPANFVYMFENASYVVTDSYHGVLFSLIFSKMFTPFFKRRGNESDFDNWRIHDLCSSLNIQVGSSTESGNIDTDRLNDKISQSKKFLQTILND